MVLRYWWVQLIQFLNCIKMKIHITDLGVQGGNLGVCVYDCRRKRIPVGNTWNKKRILVTVYRGVWMKWTFDDVSWPWFCVRWDEFGGGGWQLPHYRLCKTVSDRAARLQRWPTEVPGHWCYTAGTVVITADKSDSSSLAAFDVVHVFSNVWPWGPFLYGFTTRWQVPL